MRRKKKKIRILLFQSTQNWCQFLMILQSNMTNLLTYLLVNLLSICYETLKNYHYFKIPNFVNFIGIKVKTLLNL